MKSAGQAMGAQATESFGKKEKNGALSVLNAFLGATCEWPHETHKAKKTKTKVQKKENKEQSMWIFLWISFKCGETNVSVYLYSRVRIIPFDISSHRLQFTRRAFPVTDVTWASLLNFWLAVCCQASSSNKQTPLVSHWTNLAPQCGVNTTNALLTCSGAGFHNPG